VLGVVLVATLAVACQTAHQQDDPAPVPQRAPIDYVALGDSYTAAPLVPTTDTTDACFRSDGNYPHLLAASLPDVRLTDVSCSGADSRAMTGTQSIGGQTKPPQLDAVDADTDLVTIGLGGNDFGLFGSMSLKCFRLAQDDPGGAPCRDANRAGGGDELLDLVPRIQAKVAGVLDEIRERAPDATVVAVSYPRLLPRQGTCPDLVPLAAGDYAYVTEVNKALSDAVLGAAAEAGVASVDVYAASRGHDVCSDEPWVNGIQTVTGALALHPFAAEQAAVAELILDQL
jgi:lysophospholipase L1-like esterase